MARTRELAGDFLDYLARVRRLSARTVRAYGTDLDAFADWCGREGVSPLDVSRRQLRGYLSHMVSAGYANKTINRRVSSLRTFFGWLELQGEVEEDATVLLKGRKLAKELPRTMTNADVARMIDACDDTTDEGLRDRAFMELLYASGARISEVAGLVPRDVDFAQGQVRLFGKRSKERIVPIHDRALDALRRYVGEARPRLASRAGRGGEARALFVSARGNDMSADALRRRFHRIRRAAGIAADVGPHGVRHTFATELLNGGADLQAVQELLGHESLATTQIYTHLSVEGLKAAAKRAHPRG